MKRTRTFIAIAIFVVASVITMATAQPSYAAARQSTALTASNYHALQRYTGGGCSNDITFGISNAHMTYRSCIGVLSYSISYNANYSASATNRNLWSTCALSVRLRDDTIGTTVNILDVNCLSNIQAGNTGIGIGAYLLPPSHQFHTYTFWNGTYNGQFISGGTVNSPELSW